MISSITSAKDWYFVHDNPIAGKPPIVHVIAAWGVNEKGDVIGLIGETMATSDSTPKLTTVPPIEGMYRHHATMTPVECGQISKRKNKTEGM